jgi:hypothetical protein
VPSSGRPDEAISVGRLSPERRAHHRRMPPR